MVAPLLALALGLYLACALCRLSHYLIFIYVKLKKKKFVNFLFLFALRWYYENHDSLDSLYIITHTLHTNMASDKTRETPVEEFKVAQVL